MMPLPHRYSVDLSGGPTGYARLGADALPHVRIAAPVQYGGPGDAWTPEHLLLASVEAGLAYTREILMQDELATASILRGGAVTTQSPFMWITTAAQMGMGFTLPFALVFVAIPLETFVQSLRTVLGLLGIGALRLLRLVLRLLGSAFVHVGTALVRIYDIPIFMPLWIEQRWRQPGSGRTGVGAKGKAEVVS